MDPFSVVVGIGSLIEMSLQLGKCLKDAYDVAVSFEEEVGSLLYEIQDLESVNKSIEHLYRMETDNIGRQRLELPFQDLEVWQNTIKVLENCTETTKVLQKVLDVVIGKNGIKVSGWRDRIKKHLRKQAKDGELNQIRVRLSTHRGSLNVSLTILSLIYAQRGSQDSQKFGFQLHKQIAALQHAIPSVETDQLYDSLHSATAVASTLRLNKHFDTPKAVSSIYTGRKHHLEDLKKAFDLSHSSLDITRQKRFVVCGLGGSGKTQFCCKFASDNKQRFWGVFTVDASSPGNAQQSFVSIAKACGTNPNERAAKSLLSSSYRPWLLIIDNADDTNLDLESYFPDGENGLTLITTRNPSFTMHGTIGQKSYHFDCLDEDEANQLLLKAADNPEPWTPKVMQLALIITQKLGALPLALIHAGNAIKAKYCGLNDYVGYYERSWQLIRRNQHLDDQEDDDAEYMKVYASYEIVYRGLESMNSQRYRDAVQILKLFSFLHHEHIPFDFLVAAIKHPRMLQDIKSERESRDDEDKTPSSVASTLSFVLGTIRGLLESLAMKHFENQNPIFLPTFLRDAEFSPPSDDSIIRLREGLHILSQLSLITHYEGSDSYSMHPLVHTWVRERPQMKTRNQAVWCEVALHTLSRCILVPPINASVDSYKDLTRKLLPHIISVRKLQDKIEQEFESNRNRRIRPWPVLKSQISPWRALFLIKSAIVYNECGDFLEAENCLRIALDFYEKFLGPENPRTERILFALSGSLWHQCRIHDAADLLENTFNRKLKLLGPEHSRTLTLMARLGEVRRHQGRLQESIDLLTKAVEGMKTQLPDTDPTLYQAMDYLGITLRSCYHFVDAREYQEKAVAGLKMHLGERDIRTLISMGDLAITYKELSQATRDSNQRREYLDTAYRDAVFAFDQLAEQLGDKHPQTWIAQGAVSRIKADMGRIDEAEETFRSVLPVAARHLGDDHLGVLIHKHHHSRILIQQQRYCEAETLLLEVSDRDKYKTTTGMEDSLDRWDALWSLIECYQKQGEFKRSVETCDQLLGAMRAVQPAMDPSKQAQIGSTFFKRVEMKKEELATTQRSTASEDHMPNFEGSQPVELLFTTLSDTEIATPMVGNLRQRETW